MKPSLFQDTHIFTKSHFTKAFTGKIATVHLMVLVLFCLVASSLHATDSTISGTANGPNGSDDSWNNAANWNNGIPTGAMNAIIASSVRAQEDNVATPAYSGNLWLLSSARLSEKTSTDNIFGNGNIFLEEGSDFEVGYNGTVSLGNITLLGNAIISGGWSVVGHNDTRTFGQPISGNYTLTIEGVNNNVFNFSANNSFGELVTDSSTGTDFRIVANTAGSLGLGNVTIADRSSLIISASNSMRDTADLYLVGDDSQKPSAGTYNKVDMDADETINRLYIDGIQQLSGNYNNSQSWINGTGTLTVLSDPPPIPPNLTSIVDDIDGGPMWEDYGSNIIYTLTFDLDMDDSTVTSADFENGGNASITIGTITETSAGVFTVEVFPTSTGNLVFQVKQGANLLTSVSANLDTTNAVLDDTEIIINAGNSLDTTITGTSNGPGGSDDTWNLKANWDYGRPLGPQNAIIGANTDAFIDTQILDYSGNLTLQEGSSLKPASNTGKNAVQISPRDLIFHNNSTLKSRDGGFGNGSLTLGPIILVGEGTINLGGSDSSTVTFSGNITGSGNLVCRARNNNIFLFSTASSLSGDIVINQTNNNNYARASSNSAFGTGDLTINNQASLQIDASLTDTISDFATLNLNGTKGQIAAKVVLNSDERIMMLYVDGVRQSDGTYGSTSSSADNQDDTLFSGTGVLTVSGPKGTIFKVD